MKLQLQQGSIVEEHRLKDTIPPRPYLELSENNRTLGYLKLGSSGRSKFTFNNLYIKDMPQYLYIGRVKDTVRCFTTNLISRSIYLYAKIGDTFQGYTDYDVYLLRERDTLYHINPENNDYTSLGIYGETVQYVVDTNKNMYVYVIKRSSNVEYYLNKIDKNKKEIWSIKLNYNEDWITKLSIDGKNRIYFLNNKNILKIYDANGTLLDTRNFYGFWDTTMKNEILKVSDRTLYIYNDKFELKNSITVTYNYWDITRVFMGINNQIAFMLRENRSAFFYYYISKYDMDTGRFIFKEKETYGENGLVLDYEGNAYDLQDFVIYKYDTNGNHIATVSVNETSGDSYLYSRKMAISGDKR